jgi:rubredoxin
MILVCPRGSVRVTYNRAVCQILLATSVESVMKKYMCLICGWIYDEATGWPEDGIAAGTKWDDVPMNWTCPECGARKDDFEMVEI